MKDLGFIRDSFKAFSNVKRTPTFTKVARAELSANFSARGIWNDYKIDFYKFMDACTEEGNEFNLITLYGEDKVARFALELQKEINSDPKLSAAMGEPEPVKTEPVEAKTEPVKTVLEPKTEPVAMTQTTQAAEIKEVQTQPQQVQAGLNFNIDLSAVLGQAARQYLESDAAGILSYVGKRIEEEAMKLRPNQIQIAGGEPVVIKGKLHKAFQETLEIVMDEKQAYLAGPAGTGKTTLCGQLAEALQVPFGHISCTAGMSEAHLLGRMVADGSYVSAEFVELYENGGVFLFDEVDAADPNTLLIINSALANGHMSVPNRKDNPRAKRHPKFYAVCAANTWGNGSNEYAGRSVMDAAFLDRFAAAKVSVDYDRELEKEILAAYPKTAEKLWDIREKVATYRIRRVVSTRVFVSAARQMASGKTEQQVLDRFFTGWTPEEVAKVLA